MNNTRKFICLCVGGIFTSRSTLVLSFLLHVALFPLFFFVHLSRTCIHLLLPIRGIFQALCFAHSWIWLDTHFFILTCCWGHWTAVVVLSSTRQADVPPQRNGGDWRASNQWKWEKTVDAGPAFPRDLLFSFWPRDQCTLQALVYPWTSDWLTSRRSTCIPAFGTSTFSFRWQC